MIRRRQGGLSSRVSVAVVFAAALTAVAASVGFRAPREPGSPPAPDEAPRVVVAGVTDVTEADVTGSPVTRVSVTVAWKNVPLVAAPRAYPVAVWLATADDTLCTWAMAYPDPGGADGDLTIHFTRFIRADGTVVPVAPGVAYTVRAAVLGPKGEHLAEVSHPYTTHEAGHD